MTTLPATFALGKVNLLLAATAFLLAAPALAHAQDNPAADPLRTVVAQTVSTVIVPAYERFAEAATAEKAAVDALCAGPSSDTLDAARQAFSGLVTTFAHVEPYRFGPARTQNRYERLFFWPDRRGRALRQVQRVLGEEDATAGQTETLMDKSVAVQGLPALDFVLYGTGSEALLEPGTFRCTYAAAIAGAIATVADEMLADWNGGFTQTITQAGPDNPAYRTSGEALQDILQAAATQLELTGGQKLAAVVGDAPEAARPKRAPFWRADLTLPMISANVDAVRTILEGGVAQALPDDTLVRSALFELAQADRALEPLLADDRPFLDIASDADAHRRLAFAVIPLGAAERLIAERIQGALGLAAGFNALDGD